MNSRVEPSQAQEPPSWSQGRPTEPGIYVGFSTDPKRRAEEPSLYQFDGQNFQHWTGWYDHAIDRWIKLDLPVEDHDGASLQDPTHG